VERTFHPNEVSVVADWRDPATYASLLACDRRAFAWEWLRRGAAYRRAWTDGGADPLTFGLVAFADPHLSATEARPIWAPQTDPQVLDTSVVAYTAKVDDAFNLLALANFVSVEICGGATEHWLLSDGRWTVRLDIHDGTLLGGPLLLDHHLQGMASAERKMHALRQLIALSRNGEMPVGLQPREARAPRWILELRTADAVASGATQQEMARAFFGASISKSRWRLESASYRLRVQRLARAARMNLEAPLEGPWFE
jgi:hypothetical protein